MERTNRISALINITRSFTRARNECGSIIVMVAFMIAGCLAFAALAIDGAMLLTTRTQLHNAADAAALAGASGLLAGGPDVAVDRAIRFAAMNNAVEKELSAVNITPEDISFPASNIIRVSTHRTKATHDPLRTFFLKIVNPISGNIADVSATSAAMVFDLCGAHCLKPWAIPDRWDDANDDGIYDHGEYYDKDGTGYTESLDAGTQIVLKVGDSHETISSGVFFPVTYPPLDTGQGKPETGGKNYYDWVIGCTPYLVNVDDRIVVEPGNMVGPTLHGMEELTARDPNAYWNDNAQCISGSEYARSPRIALVPFFDPRFPPTSGRNWVNVTKIGAFFIERIHPNGDVTGRFVKVTAQGYPCESKDLGNSMVKGIALVE